jgi:cyanophycin synthetase
VTATSNALIQALPGLAEHGCSYREPGGLVRRMREDEGTWLGHVLEHVAIELQNIAGEDVSFGKTRSTETSGVYTVIYEYSQRDEGIAAGELGSSCCARCCPRPAAGRRVPADWNWEAQRDEYIRYAQRRALGPSTASLVRRPRSATFPGCA